MSPQYTVLERLDTHTQKNEIGSLFYIPYTEVNLKWKKGLIVRPETVKLSEENLVEKFLDIDLSNDFFGKTPTAWATEAKLNKQGYKKQQRKQSLK